ncbi:beta-glucosidase [Ideonella sp. 4Y11]|uniref:Beta-glucosidase n=1 Tax=Ideonella aquatica TaxID=2824119 RepID=A0A940YHG0_9BURK|nr:GH1 family beta-glucosidase [Ideonella aquatica]MBQ0957904.1 beta-glucosidase [Ideonella aquatica]
MPDSLQRLAQRFPPDFLWGVATSSFQIEGAAQKDGKGASIWDRFCRQPGAIADGSHGDMACDHYHRLEQDLDLIASLGVDCYRFSISWPRVQPLGQGAWNPAGLDFYDRLIDGLSRRGIRAFATLNHWDLPQALQDEGGWGSRDTVHSFVNYARGIQARFGDRLAGLTTHNEPWVMATLGHEQGLFAPGLKCRRLAMQVSHHLLLSHGLALQALRADGAREPLGIVLNISPCEPATDSPEDRAAARLADGQGRRWYTDPLFKGVYPEDVWADLGPDAPLVQPGDLAAIAQPLDYLGVNYYTRSLVSASGQPVNVKAAGRPVTAMDWEIYPPGLTHLLLQLKADYPGLPPVYITENGGAFADAVDADGTVHDHDRLDYLRHHIAAVADARDRGVPMAGYMVWSLMDNFEWASGYAKRFGIVHVDYQTLARTPKASARWWQAFLRECRARRA